MEAGQDPPALESLQREGDPVAVAELGRGRCDDRGLDGGPPDPGERVDRAAQMASRTGATSTLRNRDAFLQRGNRVLGRARLSF